MTRRLIGAILLGWLAGSPLRAQMSLTVLSSPPTFTINSVAAYRSGVTFDHATLRVNMPGSGQDKDYTVSVRASGNAIQGASSIPITLFTMQVITVLTTSDGGIRPLVRLSTATQTLMTTRVKPGNSNTYTGDLTIRYRLDGGTALLKPAGSYSTTLTFTLTVL